MGARETDPRVAIVALDGCMSSAISGTLEAFAIASLHAAGPGRVVQASVVSCGGADVVGAAGVPVSSTADLRDVTEVDAVMLPPSFSHPEQLAETHSEVVDWVRQCGAAGSLVGAACTGTFLLAETGLLDGRRATTTPAFEPLFRDRYPRVLLHPALRLVDEGSVVTAGATTSFLDLALLLVGRFYGPRVAVETARFLSTDPNPRPQQTYQLPKLPRPHPDEAVRSVESFIGTHLAEPIETARLSEVAGLSPRSLARRFRTATGESVTEYVQRMRVQAAMKDLEGSTLGFEEITARCGYDDVRSFRRLFRRLTGLTPRDYRQRFGYGDRGG